MIGKLTGSLTILLAASAPVANAQIQNPLFNSFLNGIQQLQQQQARPQQQPQYQQQPPAQQPAQQQRLGQQQPPPQQQREQLRAQADAKAKVEAKARADALERRTREAAAKLRGDPALVAVLGADKRDVTALIVGKDTRNVVRNMQGDPAFQQKTSACLPFGGIASEPGTPESRFLADAKAAIERKGGAAIGMTLCDPAELGRYDLVIFSAEQVATGSAGALSAVIHALKTRQFVSYTTFTTAAFDAEEQARNAAAQAEEARKAAAREAAEADFQARDASAVSAIYATSPAPVVCLIATTDVDGLRYLLKRPDSPFADVVAASSAIRELASADAIFIAFKTHGCAAAVAPAGVLQPVVAALHRDGVDIQLHAATIAGDRLAGWKDLSAQDAAESQRKLALAAEQRQSEDAARRDELARDRALIEPKADAVRDRFVVLVRRHMDSVRAELQATAERAKTGKVLTQEEQAAEFDKFAGERLDPGFRLWSAQFARQVEEGLAVRRHPAGARGFRAGAMALAQRSTRQRSKWSFPPSTG